MSDKDFIIHVLKNLPEEYEVAVESLEEKMQDKMVPLTIETVRTKINSRFEQINESVIKKNCKEAWGKIWRLCQGFQNTETDFD